VQLSDVRYESDVRNVLMNTVGDARLVASDAGTGRPAGFGRPTCRTSEGRRTSVRFGGLLTL